jgi:nicotinamidase/pyrazinamidase
MTEGVYRVNDRGLLVVDVQRDFCPGGALPVAEGDAVVAPLNRCIARFAERGLPLYFSRDWHPAESSHFASGGGPWPSHCVAFTAGAEFHPDLVVPEEAVVVSKGMAPNEHGYSAFDARDPEGRRLADSLRARGVRTLYVGGLATDYCVRASVLDALRAGFDVRVVADGVRGIDREPGDVRRALDEMRAAGAETTTSAEVERELAGAPA